MLRLYGLVRLASLSALTCSSAAAGTGPEAPNPPPAAATHDERRDAVPPAQVPDLPRAPARPWTRLSAAGRAFTSVQVNVDAEGFDIIGDQANEPSIAVSPVRPNQIAIGWRQFDTVESGFREAGYAYSDDFGRTWTFPGVLEEGVFRSDPVLAADSDGAFYYMCTSDDAPFALFKSTDGGVTWQRGLAIDDGGDKPWIAVDPTQGPGRGNIYAVWRLPVRFTRSTDRGACFDLPGPASLGYDYLMPAVAPDGTVYVIRDIGDDFRLSHSITAHDPDATPAFETISQVQMGFVLHSTPVNPGGLHGQPWIVIDHSRGPTRGNIYVLASTQTGSHLSGSDVMFSRSTDAGKTWSTPRAVSDDFQSGAWHWFGAISVAPNGRLDVTWYDTRHAPDNVISEVYYAFSNDAGETWSENIAVSPPFDPRIGAGKIGDYTHMSSNESYAMLAYAATFNGGHDIFFLRIAHDCNDNGVLDDVEVERGGSDCNANLIPDDCESGWAHDCNRNGIPDVCDIGSAASPDCDLDGEPDECSSSPDCDGDDLLDLCVLRQGLDADCNHNGVPDACDVTSGASEDRDLSGVPDDCELRVPSEYSTIQAALDAAQDDEHVILEDGIHSGPGNVALIMPQKRLVIRSAGGPQRCRIDCAGAGRAFTVSVGCRESRIQGLTILNGHAEEGGAILCTERSRVVIEGCVFHGNTGVQQGGAVYVAPQSDVVVLGCEFAGNQAQRGGALALEASMATVRDCRMIGNTADLGGGIMCQWAAPRIEQCVLSGNSAFVGAGLFVKESTPVIVGCTLYANRAVSFGGGLGVVHAEPVVTNSILSGNTGIRGTDHGERSQVELLSLAAVDVTYTVIQGLEEIAGVGNFDAPAQTLFVDGLGPDGSPGTADDDLRLISGSPAIDCGLNAAVPEGLVLDIGGLPRRIDDPKSDDCWQEGAACGRPPIVDLGPHEYQLPSLALVSSDPPDGAIDARQPADLDGSNPAGWAVIALTFNGDAGTLTAADFEIESSGGAPPAIMAVNATGPTLTVQLDGPIPVGECTTLRYIAGAAAVHLGYLPADVSGDGTSSALDILQLIDGLNGAIGLPVHQCDVDRSGQCGPNDILRTIDLLGGAAVYDPWNGAVLPACP